MGANSALALNFIQNHHKDFSIVAMARKFDAKLSFPNIQYIESDYESFQALQELFSSIENVLYCIGVTNAKDEKIKAVNEDIFSRFMQALPSRKLNIAFISSAAVLHNKGAYVSSKFFAENKLKNSVHNHISLRPSVMHGPFDKNNLVKMELIAKRLPFIPVVGPDFSIQPVYMPDIAQALARAFNEGKFTGKAYTVSGPAQITLEQVFSLLKKKLNARKPMIKIPLKPAQTLVEFMSKFLPKDKIMAHQILNMKKHPPFESSEFIKDYQFKQSSFQESLFRY